MLVATCGVGLEEILARELEALGVSGIERDKGAVSFRGSWADCWRANWRLRTANRVLVQLGQWDAADGDALARGAETLMRGDRRGGVDAGALLHPDRSFSIRATCRESRVGDTRWAALRVKDGLVDAQRRRWGSRSTVERKTPDLALRLRLFRDQATLSLDTSGESLDRRGYRLQTTSAPVREQLAAACVLAAEWDGRGPVVDPMCGSGTLLAEAGAVVLGLAPGRLRETWAFEKLPSFDRSAFDRIRGEPIPALADDVRLIGLDRDPQAVSASGTNLEAAGFADQARVRRGDAFEYEPPPVPGLLIVNPAYGERLNENRDQWRRLGDLMKQHYAGYTAVVLAGDPDRGKQIGLKPRRRIPVMNGPIEARILIFDLY